MDRLFQKGLLRRETSGKAYIYRSDMSLSQLENQFARDLIAAFLACGNQPFTVLATALVDLVDAHSPELLAEVEGQIRLRRMKVAYGSMEELALQSWLNSAGEMPLGTA
jgi:predicted transcriptional regulator